MFYAVILLCSLVAGEDNCHKFTDELGPYKTEDECKARLDEMSKVIIWQSPSLIPPGPARIELFCNKGKSI